MYPSILGYIMGPIEDYSWAFSSDGSVDEVQLNGLWGNRPKVDKGTFEVLHYSVVG